MSPGSRPSRKAIRKDIRELSRDVAYTLQRRATTLVIHPVMARTMTGWPEFIGKRENGIRAQDFLPVEGLKVAISIRVAPQHGFLVA